MQEQRAHQEAAEFLQLFSFVVFSALLIHHGSAESNDGTDRIEEAVHRLERRLEEAGIGSTGTPRAGAGGRVETRRCG